MKFAMTRPETESTSGDRFLAKKSQQSRNLLLKSRDIQYNDTDQDKSKQSDPENRPTQHFGHRQQSRHSAEHRGSSGFLRQPVQLREAQGHARCIFEGSRATSTPVRMITNITTNRGKNSPAIALHHVEVRLPESPGRSCLSSFHLSFSPSNARSDRASGVRTPDRALRYRGFRHFFRDLIGAKCCAKAKRVVHGKAEQKGLQDVVARDRRAMIRGRKVFPNTRTHSSDGKSNWSMSFVTISFSLASVSLAKIDFSTES